MYILVCSWSEKTAHNQLFQSLTGCPLSHDTFLLYTSGLHSLFLKTWNYQLLNKEIQVGGTSSVPGHIQNTFGCMWGNVFVCILCRQRTDVMKSTVKDEVGLLTAWWRWIAYGACVVRLFTAADFIRSIAPCDFYFYFFLKNRTSKRETTWL